MQAVKTWLTGWAAILFCYYAGVAAVSVFSIPLPPALLGLLLLLVMLKLRGRSATAVGLAASPLLKHMSVLFVPAVMGVGLYWQEIQQQAWPLFVAIVLTTTLSLGITAWAAMHILSQRTERE